MVVVADFQSLYFAWQQCRRRKRATPQAQRYEIKLLDNLITTAQALEAGSWRPAPPVCFAVSQPKAREIHAADFADRVVHHWLVPRLEAVFEPIFIHDVYSNRQGKETHAAVRRLQGFMQSIKCHSTPGYFLQLDIKNFFNSVDRPILFRKLQHRLRKAVRATQITPEEARFLRDLVHIVLSQDIGGSAIEVGDKGLLERMPARKRLAWAGPGKGLPIGNLSSQFFANVYLTELDQFAKHALKCKHYLRYVDDFILLHPDPRQLQTWQQQIEGFLLDRLRLQLRDQSILKPCSSGADFLGYVIKPEYRLVRRRVIGNLRAKLDAFGKALLSENRAGDLVLALSSDKHQQLQSTLASYLGHFSHAHCYGLIAAMLHRHAWLGLLFKRHGKRLVPRWEPLSVSSYRSQINWFQGHFPTARIRIQRGSQTDIISPRVKTRAAFRGTTDSTRYQVKQILVREQGWLKGGLKRRVLQRVVIDRYADRSVIT